MEELNRYLIVYVCNDRDLINLDMQIVKEASLLDATNHISNSSKAKYSVVECDYEKEIMIMKSEERIPIFDERYSEMFEKVYFEYCYILNIDNVDTFSEDVDLVYLNHKHGIIDTKDYRCFD